jgi:hypothetical protein
MLCNLSHAQSKDLTQPHWLIAIKVGFAPALGPTAIQAKRHESEESIGIDQYVMKKASNQEKDMKKMNIAPCDSFL